HVSPLSGTVPPGGCTDLTLGLDATGLALGDYFARVKLGSNDPARSVVYTDVALHVAGALAATLDMDPNTLNGGSRGRWITAYLELPPTFDPGAISIPTVRLDGTVAPDSSTHTLGDHDGD